MENKGVPFHYACNVHIPIPCVLLLACLPHVYLEKSIKLLPDARGFVCASDDGVLSAVATLEAGSESDLRRATFALHGHSGYITDCDTAASGHAVVSSRYYCSCILYTEYYCTALLIK